MFKSVYHVFIFFIYLTPTKGKYLKLNSAQSAPHDVCNTKSCLKAAEMIKNNMNPHVKPCNDFYEFTCGNFISRTTVPENGIMDNTFTKILKNVNDQKLELLFDDILEYEIKPVRYTKQFFKDCMDKDKISSFGLAPVMNRIRQLGGWPVTEKSWNEEKFSWIEVIKNAKEMGFDTDFILSFKIVTYNRSSSLVYLGPPNSGILAFDPTKGIFDPSVQIYYQKMVSLAVKLGAPLYDALMQLSSSLSFEIDLATISSDPSDDQQKLVSVAEIHKALPNLQMNEFLQSMLSLNPSVTLSGSDEVVIQHLKFFSKLDQLMDGVPKRILANYLIWRLIDYALNAHFISDQPRWYQCFKLTSLLFEQAFASMYVKRFVKQGTKIHVAEIASNIHKKMTETISNNVWMDVGTRKNALEKIAEIKLLVAYHDFLLNNGELEKFYHDLQLRAGHYFESVLAASKFLHNISISKLRQPASVDSWSAYENPLEVNAFYSLGENVMKIPTAILQENIFDPDQPNYLNYGAIGYIIGHELYHSLDNKGSTYDKYGNHKNWWSFETRSKFIDKMQCFLYQYNNYTVKGTNLHVHGMLTLGENIADNEGIREAYSAYQEWVKEHGPEPKLPGLNYTPDQLFWISNANVWCTKYSAGYLAQSLISDEHSPNMFRTIGMCSNRKNFAKDFGCAVGSRMNPKNKCEIW